MTKHECIRLYIKIGMTPELAIDQAKFQFCDNCNADLFKQHGGAPGIAAIMTQAGKTHKLKCRRDAKYCFSHCFKLARIPCQCGHQNRRKV